MRKKFFKLTAIMMAASMMSMTLFAAESSARTSNAESEDMSLEGANEDSSDSEGNSSNDSGGDSNDSSSEGDQGGQDGDSSDTKENADASQGSGSEQSGEGDTGNTNTDNNGAGDDSTSQDTQNESAKTDGAASESGSTETGADSTGTETSADPNATNDTALASTTEKKSDSTEESEGEEGRRTAEIESESWSNGEIEDVMGVKATSDGDTVTISYKTGHNAPWDNRVSNYPLTITYADGTTQTISFNWDGNEIHGDNWSEISGYTISTSSDQADTEIHTITIPASYFKDANFTVSGGKYTTSVSGEAVEEESSSNPDAVYTGISTDGNFNDWDAVTKYTLNEPEGDNCVESVAWVIDSESGYVYVYVKDDGSNSATWAGPNHNGKFAITTDLGKTLIIQLTEDGATVGAEGCSSIHKGSQWEIAIPISALPDNNGGLNFGLYLTDATLSGYGDTGNVESSVDITYDGNVEDWSNIKHTLIQYAGAGTQEIVPDGEAAIYMDNNVYGFCTTSMPAHLEAAGGDLTNGVSVLVNEDWSKALYMRLVAVDSEGNINWNPQKDGLDNGSYEYYIFATDAWGTSTNISALYDADVCYGKATVNISETKETMEWYVDTVKLAQRYGLDVTDVKMVSTQYGEIGQQLVTTAGSSTGPIGNAALCMLSAFAPFIKKKFSL
ncbi:MAG: hypothetical protein IJ695_04430 [Butyrivibrio sp.]|nr:hypothetical protein [Butyrivibrio sp.]